MLHNKFMLNSFFNQQPYLHSRNIFHQIEPWSSGDHHRWYQVLVHVGESQTGGLAVLIDGHQQTQVSGPDIAVQEPRTVCHPSRKARPCTAEAPQGGVLRAGNVRSCGMRCMYYQQQPTVTNINGQVLTYRSSQKGRLQLACDGFYYVKEKTVKQKEYWRCIYYTTKIKCHGRLHTLNGEVDHSTPHNHAAKVFKRSDYGRLSEIIIPPNTSASSTAQESFSSIHIESVAKIEPFYK
ncbi:uncharacterized protein LOC134221443 [Armigeres subalbatus]|uniref:uncharacterized protein LOC134221443 n=1 Tax=Armigeres subalbatus TaxID=124917 RepID=UPI002ED1C7C4